MRIIECAQGSEQWWQARCGVPSASNFSRIITPKTGKLSAQAHGYICELLADRILGTPLGIESYTSRPMQDGIDTEPEARAWYEAEHDVDVRQVGFVTTDDGRFGCSPDGLVGGLGGLELKCPTAKTHVGYLLAGDLPDAYRCQVHGCLAVTGAEWWDFVSYCRDIPPFRIRVLPDDFTEALRKALDEFWPLYKAAENRLRELGAFRTPEPDYDMDPDTAIARAPGDALPKRRKPDRSTVTWETRP